VEPSRGARTVDVDARRLRGWLAGFAERHGTVDTDSSDRLVELRAADGARAWLEVPFPPLAGELADHVERERRVGVVLVRRGGFAAGVFQGRTLTSSKVGTSYVQGATKAGGWSQQRYARRRSNQARAAFAEAAEVAVRILGPERQLDALICGGDRAAVDEVLADPRLAAVARLRTGPLLAVPDPRLRVLQASPDQFLAVRIALAP
jgi:hypothetical protein